MFGHGGLAGRKQGMDELRSITGKLLGGAYRERVPGVAKLLGLGDRDLDIPES